MLRVRTPFRVSGASVIAHAPVSGVSTEGSEAADIAMRGELRDHPGSASRQGAQKGRRDPTRQAARRTQSPARGARLGPVAAISGTHPEFLNFRIRGASPKWPSVPEFPLV